MEDFEDDEYSQGSLYKYIKDTILSPVHVAISPPLLRTYLRTILLLLASTVLFALAVIAYTTFYYAYIPIRSISLPVYLQYDARLPLPHLQVQSHTLGKWEKHPYGIASVQGLVSRQKYDVVVDMVVPRSERNLGAGNWMVGIELRGSSKPGDGLKRFLGWEEDWDVDDLSRDGEKETVIEKVAVMTEQVGTKTGEKPVVLAKSRRPAILIYRSWTVEHAYRALRLPLYVLGFGLESEKVEVRMMEDVSFEKGWRNIPSSLRLEVRSRTPLEVYSVAVRFVAKLEGLRWVMFNHRLASAMVFTSLFWGVEMGVVLLTWAAISLCFAGMEQEDQSDQDGQKEKIKHEGSGAATPKTEHTGDISAPPTPMSDTARTFPTLSSQQPLQYTPTSDGKGKWKEERSMPKLEDVPVKEEEADDEEDDEFLMGEPISSSRTGDLDSGIGTSMESSFERERGLGRRRSGGPGKKER